MPEAEKRAEMPKGSHSVLDRRTLATDNSNLLTLVKKGDDVLDVGCGSGAITRGIIDLVENTGSVKGIDSSEHLIDHARQHFSGSSNLSFEVADINTYTPEAKYDVITSARVLQWLSNQAEVIAKMKTLLKPGGCISILDYNHEKVEFQPAIPASMNKLYASFLKWRKDSGMDNAIADNVAEIFKSAGFKKIDVEDHAEISTPDKNTFLEEIVIWRKVAEVRGPQLVKDNYLTEDERLLAISEYESWMANEARYMKLYLKSVTAYVNG